MFPVFIGTSDPTKDAKPPIRFYNTATRSKERFTPLKKDYVRMYNCGPTVYDYAHIGNLRSYVFADIIRRTLLLNDLKVMQVVNVTDVGHLTSDADEGDDKMTLALKREGKPKTLEAMKEVADFYTEAYKKDLEALGIKQPSMLPRASEHIHSQVALISTLMEKEYAYQTSDGVYFDTSRFEGYGLLGGIDVDAQKEGVRVTKNEEKRNPADFALWKKNSEIGWDSPWGKGFPGWHVECSAMSMEYLGKELDIHTGGIDHIGTHHNNEIAQSEAATGKTFARVWMHNAHILVEGTKFSKSLNNAIRLRQLQEHGYSPLSYRFWLLGGHYRTTMSFSFHALDAAQTALTRLHRLFAEELLQAKGGTRSEAYSLKFLEAMNDDLDTPKALSLIWELVKDDTVSAADKRVTLLHFDKTLNLGLLALTKSGATLQHLEVLPTPTEDLPQEVQALVGEREQAREAQDWAQADSLRKQIEEHGYSVKDSPEGPQVIRI